MNKRNLIVLGMVLAAIINLQVTGNDSVPDTNWKDYALSDNNKDEPIYIHTPAKILNGNWPTYVKTYLTAQIKDNFKIILIDTNKNSRGDIGIDLMLFSTSSFAVPLSKTVNIDNKLYDFKVDIAQRKVSLKPYEGKTGLVDFVSGYNCSASLDLVILKSNNGDYFDVAGSKSFLLPCGTYNLHTAYIKDNNLRVPIKGDKKWEIEVKEDDKNTAVVKWGKPLRIDFQCAVNKTQINIPYKSIRIFGSANEEYVHLYPWFLPLVEIKNNDNTLVSEGKFKQA